MLNLELVDAIERYKKVFGQEPPGELSPMLLKIAKRLGLGQDPRDPGVYLVYPTSTEGGQKGDGMWISNLDSLTEPYTEAYRQEGLPDWTQWKPKTVIRLWFDETKTLQAEPVTQESIDEQ